jgi:hypothetical protein
MKLAAAVLAATAFMPIPALAGMYGDPVINLDAKSFKKAMATEHAAVCPRGMHSHVAGADSVDGSIRSTMVRSL